MTTQILTDRLSEPLDGATTAKIDIHAGDGNLTIDRLVGGDPVLASGTLEYSEQQGRPARDLVSSNGRATLTLRGGRAGRPWIRLPWSACNAAAEWRIHLNPTVPSDIAAHSDGGNIRLDLAGMAVTCVSADTGGGNIDVVLPDNAADLSVTARTGAGNVAVRIPSDVAARVHATTGLGKAIVNPRFAKTDSDTYQSPDFERAANKVEVTVNSGAGNVSVNTK